MKYCGVGAVLFLLLLFYALPAQGQVGLTLSPEVPKDFEPLGDLRAAKPMRLYANDSLAWFNHEAALFRIETEFDSTTGYWVSTRTMFGDPYGPVKVYTPEDWRWYKIQYEREEKLQKAFFDEIYQPTTTSEGGAIEIQVPFRIKSQAFRRIFGGDRVGLRVSGHITIDGGIRTEKSDQEFTTETDQNQTQFNINQTQQFNIVGNVGDKVSVEIDQDSERMFEFENAVKITYTGKEDEIIQSIEAGNVNLNLPGTQLATLSTQNEGLFGFKTVSKLGPLSITTITSLQKGEKDKITIQGGAETQKVDINDQDYIKNQYFFVDPYFREQFSRYTSNFEHVAGGVQIEQIEVYRKYTHTAGDNSTNKYHALATYANADEYADLSAEEVAELIENFNSDDVGPENPTVRRYFRRLIPDVDYTYNPILGYIRLNYAAGSEEIVAVSFRLNRPFPDDTTNYSTMYGTMNLTTQDRVLRLLKNEGQTASDSLLWDLGMRNVYFVGARGLDPKEFSLKIVRNVAGDPETHPGSRTPWIEIFGLDQTGGGESSAPDQKVDAAWFNAQYGEIIFPDLTPFDPSGYYVGNTLKSSFDDLIIPDPEGDGNDTLVNPAIYSPVGSRTITTQFKMVAEYSSVTATYDLGFNVLEGSEEVLLNGAKQKRNIDYTIDYLSGTLTLLNEAAFDQNANVEISYESGEIFQLDQRTMIGIRLEYALWEDSFIGATFLYFNEKPLDRRVKVGSEPTRNMIWDMNARLKFRPYFMTQMVNAIPLIETDEPSELTFEGEVAQVFPNPNSLDNESTGDPDGVAYIDDFEAAKRTTPFSVMRKGWHAASFPKSIPFRDNPAYDKRGKLMWYNPTRRVPIQDIWPNREVNNNVAKDVHILELEYKPGVNNFRDPSIEPEKTWNGIMRYLSAGYWDQLDTRFIEITANWSAGGPNSVIYIELGEMSEDVIPNQRLDTEDKPIGDAGEGNDILDEGEDTGIDGIVINPGDEGYVDDPPDDFDATTYDFASRQYDFWDIGVTQGDSLVGRDNEEHDPGEPFSDDDWDFELNSQNYEEINGTQGNKREEGGLIPDTEDLTGDKQLSTSNHFFRYRFRLNDPVDFNEYVKGGLDNPKDWYLIRIPLQDVFEQVGQPDLTQIKYVRLWMTDCNSTTTFKIAQFELVGNEWLEDSVATASGDSALYLTTATVNTHDNEGVYNGPPGVAGEVDPVTDIRSKEQSLEIQVKHLPSVAEGQVVKVEHRSMDLREYKQLKMFVNGGGANTSQFEQYDLHFYLRFGAGFEGANRAYYEYSAPLKPGWADNQIIIDLDRLNRLKLDAQRTGKATASEILANGAAIKVVGEPSLGKIDVWAIGLRNFGRPIYLEDNVVVWADELRLSGVRKESGLAMRSSMNAKFSDFMTLRADLNQRDAEFHQVDKRLGSNQSELSLQSSGSITLNKFFNPNLGISFPLRFSANSSLQIPKYTESGGDVRTETVGDAGNLNIWRQFGKYAYSTEHLQDRFLFNEEGQVVVDTATGYPKQDLAEWGIDTLFSTSQQYGWGASYSKSKKSPNFLLRYTLDNVSLRADHKQSYASSQQFQYQKSFSNTGSFSYNLPFESADLRIFKWTENVPVMKKLVDTRFNYWPTKISFSVDGTETRKSDKYRNADVRPNYSMTLKRSFSTGIRPFQSLSLDYNYNVDARYAREDSTKQTIFFTSMSEEDKNLLYRPGTPPDVILEDAISALDTMSGSPDGPAKQLLTELQSRIAAGEPPEEIVDYFYEQKPFIPGLFAFKDRWEPVTEDDPRYKETFWTVGGMPFVNTGKQQRVSGNWNPELVNWLTTGFNYSTAYSWNWSGFTYSGRTVSSNNSLGGNMTLRLRNLLGSDRGGGGGGSDRNKRGRDPGPDPSDFGRTDDESGQPPGSGGSQKEDDEEGGGLNINPLKALQFITKRIQDPSVNYTQNLSYTNPTVEEGDASLEYQLGLSGDPGLKQLPGFTSVASSQRTDNYRFSSGIDWTTRVSSGLSYDLRLQKSSSNNVTGKVERSGFYMMGDDGISPQLFDLPNWTLRWGGIEQYGPLSSFAQSISLEHSYTGRFSQDWEMVRAEASQTPDDGGDGGDNTTAPRPFVKQITQENYEKGFSPLIGMNITWRYQISTSVRYNWSQRMGVSPSNDSRNRDTNSSISLNASYTRKTGFRIPIPIWPFKNRRFENETTFSVVFDLSEQTSSTLETMDTGERSFVERNKSTSWSVAPSIKYNFSRTVSGGLRYKYGQSESNTQHNRTYQEFGVNVDISIRG